MKLNCLKLFSCIFVILILFSVTSYAYGPTAPNNEYCYIRAVKSGKYITVPNGTVSNGGEIKIYSGNETASQRWYIYTYSDGYSLIRSAVNSNYYLTLKSSTSTNNAKLTIEYFQPGSAVPSRALFMFIGDVTLGITYIVNKGTIEDHSMTKALEAYGGSTSDGTNIVNYDMYDGVDEACNQYWVIESTTRTVYPLGEDLVDSGGHCDWDSSSKYTYMVTLATAAWNNRLGDTIFRNDTSNVLQDVKIADAKRNFFDSQIIAQTSTLFNKITFYTEVMDNLRGEMIRLHTVTHELGHCLGLDESIQQGNIMTQGGRAYGTSISLDDVATYELT